MKKAPISENHSALDALGGLVFTLICQTCGNDIDCIQEAMLKYEQQTRFPYKYLGFFVYDIQNNLEKYSPKFRKTLGYSVEEFPDVPASWQRAIHPDDLKRALDNFHLHAETKGAHPYTQEVRYKKKGGEVVHLLCHGKIVTWEDGKPVIMIGLHSAV